MNIAQCFREPAQYYMLTGDSTMLHASYNVHDLIRRTFGQVPGGMFGSDENARLGYIDPRQGVETCGMVEQMASDEIMLRMTGDPFWAEHCEEVQLGAVPCHEPVQQPVLPAQPCFRMALFRRTSGTCHS